MNRATARGTARARWHPPALPGASRHRESGILKQEPSSGQVPPLGQTPVPSLLSLHCAHRLQRPRRIPRCEWSRGRCLWGWQPCSRRERGHTAGSKLDRLFNTTLAQNTLRVLPAPGTAVCPRSVGRRGRAAWEGGRQGTPIRLGDPPGQKGKTAQAGDDALAISTQEGASKELSQCCQKLKRAKAPSPLPACYARGRAQHHPPHKAPPARRV